MRQSAGTLLYRTGPEGLEVLIVHPSGTYNRRAPWSIPKGEPDDDETLEATARRETFEETGVAVSGELVTLGHCVYQKSRKRVHCFAGPAPADAAPRTASWEIDQARFVPLAEARELLHLDQRVFVDRLAQHLSDGGVTPGAVAAYTFWCAPCGARATLATPEGGATMRTILAVGTAALVLASATATGAEVQVREITFKSGDEEVKGFVAEPAGKGPFPAVVVIQEWWGLNDWIKDNAKRLAEKGYVALAPDLYRGKVTEDPGEAGQLLRGLPRDRALRDLKGAVGALAGMEKVQKDRVGCVGWCMGGGFALELAQNDDRVKACVICYGRVVSDAEKLKPIGAEVLGIFGEDDRGIPAAGVRQFEEALKKAGKKVEAVQIYKGAGHGFMRAKNGANPNPEYREAAAKDAWERIDKFFARTLGGK